MMGNNNYHIKQQQQQTTLQYTNKLEWQNFVLCIYVVILILYAVKFLKNENERKTENVNKQKFVKCKLITYLLLWF